MIAQFVSFLFCSVCFIVIGALTRKVTKWQIPYYYDVLIGLSSANAFFTLISIFHALDDVILYVFISILLLLSFFNKNWLKHYFVDLYKQSICSVENQKILALTTLLFIVVTFFQSLYAPTLHYDAALYHIPNIKWISEQPTLKGLVHININFGYNFNIFSLYAPFTFHHIFGQYIFVINLIVTCLFAVWSFFAFDNAIRAKKYLLCIIYLLVLYYLIVNYWCHVSTPSNDIIVFILTIIVFVSFANLKKNTDLLFPIFILSIYTVTIKLSAGPILLLAFYAFFQKTFWHSKIKTIYTLLSGAFTLLPWLYKNVLLTGWIVFPFPYIDLFSVDWKISTADVIIRKELIRNFYIPNKGKIEGNWLKEWYLSQSIIDIGTITLTILLTGLLGKKIINKEVKLASSHLIAILVSLGGILYMLSNSPSLRYSIAFFLVTIILAMKVIDTNSAITKYIFYLSSIALIVIFLKQNWYHPWHFVKNISQRMLLPYSYAKLNEKNFSYFLIDNRVKCYYPIGSDQCYDQQLPCSSVELRKVHLRGKTLEEGFYKDYEPITSELANETHY